MDLTPATEMVATVVAEVGDGQLGAAVDVPDSAPLWHRVIGLTGRDPAWQPS